MVLGCSLAAAHPGAAPHGFGGYVGSSLVETRLPAEREVSQVLHVKDFDSFLFSALSVRFMHAWLIQFHTMKSEDGAWLVDFLPVNIYVYSVGRNPQ